MYYLYFMEVTEVLLRTLFLIIAALSALMVGLPDQTISWQMRTLYAVACVLFLIAAKHGVG